MKNLPQNISLKNINTTWVEQFSIARKEPAWLTQLRVRAFEQYSSLPMPGPKDETWKRTHLSSIPWDKLEFNQAATGPDDSSPADLNAFSSSHEDAGNGRAPGRFFINMTAGNAAQISPVIQKKGVEWHSLDNALRIKPEKIQSAWETMVLKAKNDKFRSLVLALANRGSVLFISRGAQIRTPLQQYIRGHQKCSAQFILNFIFVEDDASVHLWEEGLPSLPTSDNGREADMAFLISQSIMHLGTNAKAQIFHLQNWESSRVHFQYQDIFQKAASRLDAVFVAMGGRTLHSESSIHLEGEKAENKVLGVLFSDHQQNFETFVHQNHTARHTTSDIQFRGALKGQSSTFFSGLVFISPEAQQSDAYQACKFLLLSSDAKADAIPNLEILADDVKCSHGAAVGPVDKEQRFYLETRGLPPQQAEQVIIQGFVEPVIAAIPDEQTQKRLRSYIEEKMKT